MVKIKQKTTVKMQMSAVGDSHSRSKIAVRDLDSVIDEPEVRGGTNLGPSPTETLMTSLIGCTNVISKKIAHAMDVEFGNMKINLSADFDRRGVLLTEEVDTPFSNVVLDIEVATNASEAQLDAIKTDLAKYCPIAKVMRAAGITITENWTTTPL